MSLVGSIFTPDGIVIAGDSLATISGSVKLIGEGKMACTGCNTEQIFRGEVASHGLPMSTFPFSQKIFPFLEKFGVGTVGAGQLGGKTIYFLLRQLEHSLTTEKKEGIDDIDQVAKLIGDFLHKKLAEDIRDLEKARDDFSPLGIKLVGYKGNNVLDSHPMGFNIHLGKTVRIEKLASSGPNWSGQCEIAKMFANYPAYGCFSLQDAVDYAEFIIDATAKTQRFSGRLPNVGGAIDIALITPFDKFKWIKQKELR